MPHVNEIKNPIQPHKDLVSYEVPAGITIAELLKHRHGETFIEFPLPTICLINGQPLLRKEWNKRVLHSHDIVEFVQQPLDPYTIIYWVVVIIIAIVAYSMIPKPQLPNGSQPQADPVYTLAGQRNQVRLGNPIEVAYGRNRLWPSYAARAYNRYIGNDQFQYSLFCFGQGEFDFEALQIEDSAIASFQEVEYEIYAPGESVTLFPDNVETSSEVGGIDLPGPNEVGYAGYIGPFAANSPGTVTEFLEVDVVLPAGCYFIDDKGKMVERGVNITFQRQTIDDAGTPLDSWFTFATLVKNLKTTTPQRFTLDSGTDLIGSPARYQVRAIRNNPTDLDTRAQNKARWDGIRAFLPSTRDYGNVTLWAVKARATNNLNDNSANRFNAIATRKLPLYDADSGTFSALTATRSLTAAFIDACRNTEYGGKLANQYIALGDLAALEAIYAAKGIYFDFVFEQRTTLWDVLKTIARVGRAIPIPQGSQVTMIRDFVKTVATGIFNQPIMVQNSFKWDVRFSALDEYDGVEVEYVDPVTFLPATIKCLVGDDAGENCEQIKFSGCTDRTRAWREGMYEREKRRRLRETVTFQTGTEGLFPSYGDLFKVAHDLPKWGKTSGQVVSISGTTIVLTEPVTFAAGVYVIVLRTKNGDVSDSKIVTAGADAYTVESATPFDPSDFFFDGINERPIFMFGLTDEEGTLCLCTAVTPQGDDKVEIKAAVNDNAVHSHDDETPSTPVAVPSPPAVPDVPVMPCSNVIVSFSVIDETTATLSWPATLGALYYEVQRSADGVTWDFVANVFALFYSVPYTAMEQLYVRVRPHGKGVGTWCSPGVGGDPGNGGDTPPPSGNEAPRYRDFVEVVTLPTLAYETRAIGGLYTLYGHSEFASATFPYPKKYLRNAISLDAWFCIFACSSSCAGNSAERTKYTASGNADYNRTTGVLTGVTQNHYREVSSAPCAVPSTFVDSGVVSDLSVDGNWMVLGAVTQTNKSATARPSCYNFSGVTCVVPTVNSATAALSQPNTDQSWWDDFTSAGFSGWSPVVSFPSDASAWKIRGAADFDGEWTQRQFRLVDSGLISGISYVFDVLITQYEIATATESDYATLSVSGTVDGSGNLEISFDIPQKEGFRTYIKSSGDIEAYSVL